MPRPSPFLLHGWLAEWWRHYGDGVELRGARRAPRRAGSSPRSRSWSGRRAGAARRALHGRPRGGAPRPAAWRAGAERASAELLIERTSDESCDVAELPRPVARRAGSRHAAGLAHVELIQRIEAPVLDLTAGLGRRVPRPRPTPRSATCTSAAAASSASRATLTDRRARASSDELERRARGRVPAASRCAGRAGPTAPASRRESGKRFQRAALRAAVRDRRRPHRRRLRLDGRAIAFHYWFALEGRMYVHRLAFDPALSRWSPGLVNTLDAIEAAAGGRASRGSSSSAAASATSSSWRMRSRAADATGSRSPRASRGRAYAAAQMATIRTRLRLKQSPAAAPAVLRGPRAGAALRCVARYGPSASAARGGR